MGTREGKERQMWTRGQCSDKEEMGGQSSLRPRRRGMTSDHIGLSGIVLALVSLEARCLCVLIMAVL